VGAGGAPNLAHTQEGRGPTETWGAGEAAFCLMGGSCPGSKNDVRAGEPLLRGQAGRAGAVQPGGEKAPGRADSGLPVLKGGLEERWGKSF